jgi:hypothetical protein
MAANTAAIFVFTDLCDDLLVRLGSIFDRMAERPCHQTWLLRFHLNGLKWSQ